MSGPENISHRVWGTVKVLLFQLCVLFWLIKLGYAARAYFLNGTTGLRNVILHGSPIPRDPALWGHPQWIWVFLRYGAIAVLTVGIGYIGRWELKQWWIDIRHGRARK